MDMPTGVYKRTEKIKNALKVSRKGAGIYKRIKPVWNKGKRGIQKGWSAGKRGIYSKETLLKMSLAKIGKPSWSKGVKFTDEHRKNISIGHRGIHKIDTKTKITVLLRQCFKYRQWRSDVFTRDDFTCQECLKRGGDMEAHHIKAYSKILNDNGIIDYQEALDCEELWNINNGITLCIKCHRLTFNHGLKAIE